MISPANKQPPEDFHQIAVNSSPVAANPPAEKQKMTIRVANFFSKIFRREPSLKKLEGIRQDPHISLEDKQRIFATALKNMKSSNQSYETVRSLKQDFDRITHFKKEMTLLKSKLETDGYVPMKGQLINRRREDIFNIEEIKKELDSFIKRSEEHHNNFPEFAEIKKDLKTLQTLVIFEGKIYSPSAFSEKVHADLDLAKENTPYMPYLADITDVLAKTLNQIDAKENPEAFKTAMDNLIKWTEAAEPITKKTTEKEQELDQLFSKISSSIDARPQMQITFNPDDNLADRLRSCAPPQEILDQLNTDIDQINIIQLTTTPYPRQVLKEDPYSKLRELRDKLEAEKEIRKKPIEKVHANLENLLLSSPPPEFKDFIEHFKIRMESICTMAEELKSLDKESQKYKDELELFKYKRLECGFYIDGFAKEVFSLGDVVEGDHRAAMRHVIITYLSENNDPIIDKITNMPTIDESNDPLIRVLQIQINDDVKIFTDILILSSLSPGQKLIRRGNDFFLDAFDPNIGASDDDVDTLKRIIEMLTLRTESRLPETMREEIYRAATFLSNPREGNDWIRSVLTKEPTLLDPLQNILARTQPSE